MKNILRLSTPLLTIMLLSPVVAHAEVSASDVKAMKAQIATLTQEVDKLEAQSKDVPAGTSAVATKGSFPGSMMIPGTSTSVKIGGYVKLDAIEDIGSGYGANFAKFGQIPLNNTAQANQSSQTTFGAQQSRVNFETRTPSAVGDIKTFIEADFYGANAASSNTNGYGLELRQAYGEVGPILAGQTWTNFQDTVATPETMDYEGPAGRVFVRQPQVRYTHVEGPLKIAGSVEAPVGNQSTNTQAAVTYVGTAQTARGQLPDVTLRADYAYASDGYVSVRGLVNDVNVDHASGANNYNASKVGYGVAVSGKQTTVGKDFALYNLTWGYGTGRYIYDIGAAGNFYNSTTNTMDAVTYYTAIVGYQHAWSSQFRSNIFGGVVRSINDTGANYIASTAAANKSIASGHVNLIWQPATTYSVGLEYMHGYRKVQNGEEGNLNRVQASFMYNF